MNETVVVALGGNAILQSNQKGTIEEQMLNVANASKSIVKLIEDGYRVVIVHGNGPQVGNILVQNAAARKEVPSMPMDVCGAESQGLIGYMIQQNILNELRKKSINKKIATVITQTIVDKNDYAFKNPTKPVGAFYSKEEAEKNILNGESWIEDKSRGGWRKLVASPMPKEIIEIDIIKDLVERGFIVVSTGGGGIPVIEENNKIIGIEAVIDKDLGASILAKKLKADYLVIATDVKYVSINFGKKNQENLETIDIDTAKKYLDQGEFGSGSMKPKVKAIIEFVKCGGKGIITSLSNLSDALKYNKGTRIINKF